MKESRLQRFIDAQEGLYDEAYQQIKNGKKTSHWMWFIFPQIAGLGYSEMAKKYAITDRDEAENYLNHPILGPRLIEISKALAEIRGKSAHEILGNPDDVKLQSCMTLFDSLNNTHPIFKEILDEYYQGQKDMKTLELLGN